ncbi:MAG TPA: hemerythrin family protein [Candidatus Omnitrophota bacterium]|nr:hemerythrin family protein [Candidatus Omnitrophota bacterium]
MSIAWRDAMDVGEPSIDADHKHLVAMINEFEAAISGRIDHRGVAVILLKLFEYTAEHFTREEEIQLRVRYPYFESHRRSHRDVLKKLTDLVQTYTKAEGAVRDNMIRTMAGFLKEWLVDHIIQSDLRMKPYIARHHAEMVEAEKRKRAAIAQSEHMAGVAPKPQAVR